ncbi:MAG TPA: pyruvate kinase [bacterium]|nr:pyruvate kinase [bacterium]HPN30091.1 pyruvate kinase [bacterium]
MSKQFIILTTIGPALNNKELLNEMIKAGSTHLRFNGAHLNPDQLKLVLKQFADCKAYKVLDLPGNKIRTNNIFEPITFSKGDKIQINDYNINYGKIIEQLKAGMEFTMNDSLYHFKIMEKTDNMIIVQASNSGQILNNKGIHFTGIDTDKIPLLLEKDRELIKTAVESGIDFLNLSFVRDTKDIFEARKIIESFGHPEVKFMVKIETKKCMENLEQVLNEENIFVVDRGDLSSEIGLMNLPEALIKILKTAKLKNKTICFATQFLTSMVTNSVPLIAELNDLYNVIKSGIDGIQLSEETAIGKYPLKCVDIITKMREKIYNEKKR